MNIDRVFLIMTAPSVILKEMAFVLLICSLKGATVCIHKAIQRVTTEQLTSLSVQTYRFHGVVDTPHATTELDKCNHLRHVRGPSAC